MISVLLIDNHHLIRTSFRHLLERESDINIVGDTSCGDEGLRACAQLSPDLIIMSSFVQETCGLTYIRRILQQDAKAKVLVLTTNQSTHVIEHMLRLGVKGIMSKSVECQEFLDGIRAIAAGRHWLEGKLAQQVALRRTHERSGLDVLSTREFEVFCLVSRGLSNQEIAEKLSISEKTVAVHKGNIMKKLAIKNVARLVLMALEHGILSINTESADATT